MPSLQQLDFGSAQESEVWVEEGGVSGDCGSWCSYLVCDCGFRLQFRCGLMACHGVGLSAGRPPIRAVPGLHRPAHPVKTTPVFGVSWASAGQAAATTSEI